ncbi:MAG: hypothetical protein KAS62_07980 [Candidatus Delongbacteria bacterium]|nr:hypothetical protein [Candidatus Delongbacteria bacterium]
MINFQKELTRKQIRIIKNEIDIVLLSKNLTNDDSKIKEIGYLSTRVFINNNEFYFQNKSLNAIKRIVEIIFKISGIRDFVSYNDIYQAVVRSIEKYLNNKKPLVEEYIDDLEAEILGKIKEFTFVCKIDGLVLKEVDQLPIGNFKIRKYEESFIKDKSVFDIKTKNEINQEFSNSLIIVGTTSGTFEVAQAKYYHIAELTLSVLRLYSCALYRRAVTNMNIRLINDCWMDYRPALCFGWEQGNDSIILSQRLQSKQDIQVDGEFLDEISLNLFYVDLVNLIEKDKRTELEEAIVKSLYWIGEAQKENSYASAWLKLWSCVECYFALDKEEITEKNAKGITSILVYGGFQHEDYSDYKVVKKKVIEFYDMRSKIVHRAEYENIDEKVLVELSYMVSWMIITMTSLLVKGYTTLLEIQEQAEKSEKLNLKSPVKKNIK